MLAIVLLSTLWATASTMLIQPWFWRGIFKRKTIIQDGNNRGLPNSTIRQDIIIQVIIYLVMFVCSFFVYSKLHIRRNILGSIHLILFSLLFQLLLLKRGRVKHYQVKRTLTMILMILIAIIGIVDQKISYWSHSYTEEKIIPFQFSDGTETVNVPDKENLEVQFGLDGLQYPIYSNGKLLYYVPQGEILQRRIKGIVVVETKLPLHAKYIKCGDYHIDKKIRDRYPNSRIKELGVVISDTKTPYAKFAIIKIKNAKPYVEKIVLKKLVDEVGEDIFEFEVSELPEFAKVS